MFFIWNVRIFRGIYFGVFNVFGKKKSGSPFLYISEKKKKNTCTHSILKLEIFLYMCGEPPYYFSIWLKEKTPFFLIC